MNEVFKSYLDFFVIVFIDDILIYSHSNEKHEHHLRIVLGILKEKKLYAKFSKYEYWISSIALMGHGVSKEGIMLFPKKIEVFDIGSGLLQLLRFRVCWDLQVIIADL